MAFPGHIFKAYDIRGLVDGELSEALAYRVARAFVTVLKERGIELEGKQLIVGRDMRPSSGPFMEQVIKGFIDEGMDVVNIGMATTPLFNFSCAHIPEYAGGIIVTASHNPAEYNGFKLTMDDGLPIGKDTGMDRIRDLAEAGEFTDAEEKGSVSERDMREVYINHIFSFVDTESIKPLKIVIDAGNGMGETTFPMWLKRLPVEVEYLYLTPDGTFPNHEANPVKTHTLKDLQAKVQEVGADFGFALDGDADRIGLVDEKGDVVDASYVSALLGLEYLKVHPKGHMLYNLISSKVQRDVWEAAGATTDMCMVGHARIKKMMREENAMFAGELSLHMFFGDMYNLESTDRCLLIFLALLSREEKPLSELVAPLKVYAHSGEINFEVEDKDATIQRVRDRYEAEATEDIELDGLWLGFDWGWLSVRKSNTEPVLRLNLETGNKALTEEKVKEITAIIEQGA